MSVRRRAWTLIVAATLTFALAGARPSTSSGQEEKKKTVGDIVEVVTKFWGYAQVVKELVEAKTSLELKDPRSATLANVELGAVVTVPWEIDYNVNRGILGDYTVGDYFCHFKITLDGTVVQQERKICNKGIDSPLTPVAGVLMKKWACGQKTTPSLKVEAWLEYYVPASEYEGFVDWPGAAGYVQKHPAVSEEVARKSAEVKFEIYDPFYFPVEDGLPAPGFKVDPGPPNGFHDHHANQDVTATVKVQHDPRYNPPSTSHGYHFDLIGGEWRWRYLSGVILADWVSTESHHQSKTLGQQNQGTRGAVNTWSESVPHTGAAAHLPGAPTSRQEEWRAQMKVKGTRKLKTWDGKSIDAEWTGEVRNGDLCRTDLQVRDADAGPH